MKKYYWKRTADKCGKCPYASYRDNEVVFCGVCWRDIFDRNKKPQVVRKE